MAPPRDNETPYDELEGIIYGQARGRLFFVPVHKGFSCVISPETVERFGLRLGMWIAARIRISEMAEMQNILSKHVVEYATVIEDPVETRVVGDKWVTMKVAGRFSKSTMFRGKRCLILANRKLGYLIDIDNLVPDRVLHGGQAIVEVKCTISPADNKSSIFVVKKYIEFRCDEGISQANIGRNCQITAKRPRHTRLTHLGVLLSGKSKHINLFPPGEYSSDNGAEEDTEDETASISTPLSNSSTSSFVSEMDDSASMIGDNNSTKSMGAADRLYTLMQSQWLHGRFRDMIAAYDSDLYRKLESLLTD